MNTPITRTSRSGRRDASLVVAAEVLLHHGLSDAVILSYLARSWPREAECRHALAAAHILIRREHGA